MIDVYITKLGDMWDQIAYKVYGDEKYESHLLKANPDYSKIIIFDSGYEIYCPDIPIEVDSSLPPWKRGD